MNAFEYILLVVAVLLGGGLGVRMPGLSARHLHLLLTVSGAYLLSITALHLLPEAFTGSSTPAGLALLLGFFLQIGFEQLSRGVEHGHIHAHDGGHLALPVLIGLSLHALLEGSPLAVFNESVHHGHDHNHLLVGIALHKIPAGFALSVLLTKAGYTRVRIAVLLVIFAAMSPLGALLGESFMPVEWIPYLMAMVAGSLLHVSTTILFELDDPHHHRLTTRKLFAIAAGIGAALLTAHV